MTRTTLMLLAALAVTACSSDRDVEAELRDSCHAFVDVLATADGNCELSQLELRGMHAQCDQAPVLVNECSDPYLDYVYCLTDEVWVCKAEYPAPLPADPDACANEKALYERCVRDHR